MKRGILTTLFAALMLSALVFGWCAYGQSRVPASSPPFRGWDYMYDTASKAFPTEADKAKITFYDKAGWELITVAREDDKNVLVFKRPKQP